MVLRDSISTKKYQYFQPQGESPVDLNRFQRDNKRVEILARDFAQYPKANLDELLESLGLRDFYSSRVKQDLAIGIGQLELADQVRVFQSEAFAGYLSSLSEPDASKHWTAAIDFLAADGESAKEQVAATLLSQVAGFSDDPFGAKDKLNEQMKCQSNRNKVLEPLLLVLRKTKFERYLYKMASKLEPAT